MKIIHCADLHLDSKMETNLTATKARERRYEILESFENMIEYAKEQGVCAIIIAGDLFDTLDNIQQTIKKRTMDAIARCPEIDFLYLQGNHDNSNYFNQVETVPQNLKVFGTDWVSYEYDDVCITGVEFGGFNENRIYSELRLEPKKTNIVTMHGQIVCSNAEVKAGEVNLSQLKGKGIDYLALGHLHEYQAEAIDTRGIYCYSGCLEGRGYDECGVKGFVLIEVDNREVKHKFIPTSKRVIHNVQVDVSNETETEILMKAMESVSHISNQDYVKLTFVGEIAEDISIDIMYLERKLSERYYSFKIQDKTELEIDFFKYTNDISLKGEFIRTVETLGLPKDEMNKIVLTGLQALKGQGGL